MDPGVTDQQLANHRVRLLSVIKNNTAKTLAHQPRRITYQIWNIQDFHFFNERQPSHQQHTANQFSIITFNEQYHYIIVPF